MAEADEEADDDSSEEGEEEEPEGGEREGQDLVVEEATADCAADEVPAPASSRNGAAGAANGGPAGASEASQEQEVGMQELLAHISDLLPAAPESPGTSRGEADGVAPGLVQV